MPRYTLSFVAAVGLVMLVAIGLLESTVGLVLFPFRPLIAPAVIVYLAIGAGIVRTRHLTVAADTTRFDLIGAVRSVVLWAQWPRLLRR